MNPLTSERNLTPSSMGFLSVTVGFAGTAVAGQILIGPLCARARVAAPGRSVATAMTVAAKRGRLIRAQAKRGFMCIDRFLSGEMTVRVGARARVAGSRRAINGQTTSAYFWAGSAIGEQKYRTRSPSPPWPATL